MTLVPELVIVFIQAARNVQSRPKSDFKFDTDIIQVPFFPIYTFTRFYRTYHLCDSIK